MATVDGTTGDVTLVFLPGSLCDERLFASQIVVLGSRHPTTVVDYTGCISIADMARHALVCTTGPLIPIGLSLGGIVAAEMIEQAPDRIVSCVLLDTNLAPPDEGQVASRHRWASQARTGRFPDVVHELVPLLTVDPVKNGGLVADMALKTGPRRFLEQNEALINRGHDRSPIIGRFGGPVLVIVGAGDQVCPPAVHRDLVDSAPKGRLSVVAGAGHLSTIDRPQEVSDAIGAWLSEGGLNT